MQTIPQLFLDQARRFGDRPFLWAKRGGRYRPISWGALAGQVEETALGLLDLGIKLGDRAAIFSENRPEWAVADLAILSAGGVTVPIYTSLTTPEIEHLLTDSGARILFVSDTEKLARLFPLQEKLDLKIILMDAPVRVAGPRIWWIGELGGLGRTGGPELKSQLVGRIQAGRGESLCSLIYTSGTTGNPKGVMLTHDNFLSNCEATVSAVPVGPDDLLLSFLPLSHVFERMAGYYYALRQGAQIAYAESMEKVAENLLETRPTLLTGVPRFFEKIHERIEQTVAEASPLKQRLFRWALGVGERRSRRLQKGQPVPTGLMLVHRVADRLVLGKLRARMGGRLRFCISGGAPLAKPLAEFFHAAGILLLEGYGLTETSPVITANRPQRFRFGSVGLPLSGVEVRIAEDGEILTRGPHVMSGYFHNPEATAEVIDRDGWFHTGDIGRIDSDGFLFITDRKKDLIKTSGGKMAAPQNLENGLKQDPWVADCVVIGDRRKFLSVLIVPEFDRVERFARLKRLAYANRETLLRLPEIRTLYEERLERFNRELASFEQLKRFLLLEEPFSSQEGILTPTLKIKRRA
ncbi:MAG: hypothetical protein COV76_02240, partial [Candidatus Omnitrophica bacterium CG11_big_fil_rev_8_21_14_0_20_64_10]